MVRVSGYLIFFRAEKAHAILWSLVRSTFRAWGGVGVYRVIYPGYDISVCVSSPLWVSLVGVGVGVVVFVSREREEKRVCDVSRVTCQEEDIE